MRAHSSSSLESSVMNTLSLGEAARYFPSVSAPGESGAAQSSPSSRRSWSSSACSRRASRPAFTSSPANTSSPASMLSSRYANESRFMSDGAIAVLYTSIRRCCERASATFSDSFSFALVSSSLSTLSSLASGCFARSGAFVLRANDESLLDEPSSCSWLSRVRVATDIALELLNAPPLSPKNVSQFNKKNKK